MPNIIIDFYTIRTRTSNEAKFKYSENTKKSRLGHPRNTHVTVREQVVISDLPSEFVNHTPLEHLTGYLI